MCYVDLFIYLFFFISGLFKSAKYRIMKNNNNNNKRKKERKKGKKKERKEKLK